MHKLFSKSIALSILISGLAFASVAKGQHVIVGEIKLDTSIWAPKAYLSMISDFTQMHTMSYQSIIERVDIDGEGNYSFGTEFIPKEDHLYRVHFSKKDDPPASLIIGGREENHFFLLANKNARISIKSGSGENLFNNLEISGYEPNRALREIDKIANYLDTLDYYGTNLNREFIAGAVRENLRNYADSCSHPLISLYALYNSNFESDYQVNPDFYKNYLKKWKKEDSAYFQVFKSQINMESTTGNAFTFILLVLLLALPVAIFLLRKRSRANSGFSELTVQERRVFSFLQQGLSNKEISDELGVSLSTVKTHVNNIYSKLKISSRKEVMDYKE